MTEDEFVEYIFSKLYAIGIKPLSWYEEYLRRLWNREIIYSVGRRNGKTVILREVKAARNIIEEHYRKDFPEKEEP